MNTRTINISIDDDNSGNLIVSTDDFDLSSLEYGSFSLDATSIWWDEQDGSTGWVYMTHPVEDLNDVLIALSGAIEDAIEDEDDISVAVSSGKDLMEVRATEKRIEAKEESRREAEEIALELDLPIDGSIASMIERGRFVESPYGSRDERAAVASYGWISASDKSTVRLLGSATGYVRY